MKNNIDVLIDEAIHALSVDSPIKSADCLLELADCWSKAGLTKESFLNMRTYIVREAEKLTDSLFIKEKLVVQERELRRERDGK